METEIPSQYNQAITVKNSHGHDITNMCKIDRDFGFTTIRMSTELLSLQILPPQPKTKTP